MCVYVCVAGAVEVRKEGLEAQINRLAELIGRLENKVRNNDTHTHRQTLTNQLTLTYETRALPLILLIAYMCNPKNCCDGKTCKKKDT